MGMQKPRTYSFYMLREFVKNTWKRNVSGGGYRPVSAQGLVSFINKGADGDSFIRVSYGGVDVVDLTDQWVEVNLPTGLVTVPMIRLVNRVLEDNNVPYFVPTYNGAHELCYADGSGTAIKSVITATYFHEFGRFVEVNNKTVPDYRVNKGDN